MHVSVDALIADCLGWFAHHYALAGQARRLRKAVAHQDLADYYLAQAIGWASR